MWDESLIIHKKEEEKNEFNWAENESMQGECKYCDRWCVCISLDTAEGIIMLGVWMVGASYCDSQLLGQKKKTKWQREKPKERDTISQLIIKVVPSRKS